MVIGAPILGSLFVKQVRNSSIYVCKKANLIYHNIACAVPVLQENVEGQLFHNGTTTYASQGSVLVLYCNKSDSNYISVCTQEGIWNPNPTLYTCKGNDDKTLSGKKGKIWSSITTCWNPHSDII